MGEIATPLTLDMIVQLRSGGIPMAIDSIEGDRVSCVWMDGARVRERIFSAHLLQRYMAAGTIALTIYGCEPRDEVDDLPRILGRD